MFEGLQDIAAAWRTIAHLSEWTGLSVGALAGLAALAYFVPLARRIAIAAGLSVAIAWAALMHGDAVGRADVQKQWDDAKAAAVKAEAERDAAVERELEQKYQPALADLQKQSDDHKAKADSYESKIAALAKRAPASGHCLLGAAADRLRGKH